MTLREAVHRAGIAKHVGCHIFRHSFATHLLDAGYNIRTIQELPEHSNVNATLIYTQVHNMPGHGIRSLLDALQCLGILHKQIDMKGQLP